MKTISIIGAGLVGRCLGRLLALHKQAQITSVYCRRMEHAKAAVAFIGAGRAIDRLDTIASADIYMVTTPDDVLQSVASAVLSKQNIKKGSIFFHCSGVLSSAVFTQARAIGCYAASVHPVKSFADPALSAKTFAGTYCAIEGDQQATTVLHALFHAIGGKVFSIKSDNKAMYHAATVMACNYFLALIDIASTMYEESGLSRKQAYHLMEPIVTGTVRNIFSLGTVQSLTGPIARGDVNTISQHLQALQGHDDIRALYTRLGLFTLEISRKQGKAGQEKLATIKEKLTNDIIGALTTIGY